MIWLVFALGWKALAAPSAADIRPLFAKYCSRCHPAESKPDFSIDQDLQHSVESGVLYKRLITEKSMPEKGSREAALLDDADRARMGEWIQAAAAAPPPAADPGLTPLVQKCVGCHGPRVEDSDSNPRPLLNGQNRMFLKDQLSLYVSQKRLDPTMNVVAALLTPDQVEEVTRYFSNLERPEASAPPAPASVREASLFAEGKKIAQVACNMCHMNPEFGDKPSNGHLPILAGQSRVYLWMQLVGFKNSDRRSPEMHALTENFSIDDLEALATYFSLRR